MYIQKYYKVIRVIKDGDGGATPLYIENVSDSDGLFKLAKFGTAPNPPNLIYRIDDGEWFEYDVATLPGITVPTGSKIYFRASNPNGFNQVNNYHYFNFTHNYNIGGYLTSLLALDNFNTISDVPNYSFYYLFKDQNTLLNAEDLITDNIVNVGISSFANNFQNCTNLATGPNFSNLSTVGNTAFRDYFNGCTNLQVVYAPNISTWNTGIFSNWLKNVSPTGVIYKPANLTIPTDSVNGVPTGWTTVNY